MIVGCWWTVQLHFHKSPHISYQAQCLISFLIFFVTQCSWSEPVIAARMATKPKQLSGIKGPREYGKEVAQTADLQIHVNWTVNRASAIPSLQLSTALGGCCWHASL